MRDTGLDLFCETVRCLARARTHGAEGVHFIVTGLGGERELELLQVDCQDTPVLVSWRRNLTRTEFLREFRSCHAALSLKLPDTPMAQTTFPSKVVEITGNGLLLITTCASDIPLIFDATSAVLVEPRASDLAEAILAVAARPLQMQTIASRGRAVAGEVFDEISVGARLLTFLKVPNAR